MYLCTRFHKEIERSVIHALRMEMSEPSINSNASRCNGSRISVDCLLQFITRYFRQPPFEEVVYGTTLLFNKSVIAVRMIIKVAPVTYKGKKNETYTYSNVLLYYNLHGGM